MQLAQMSGLHVPRSCCTQKKIESIYVFTASTKRQASQDYVLPCHAWISLPLEKDERNEQTKHGVYVHRLQ
jgi:hypothetical protein